MAVRADSTSNGMIQRTKRFSLNVLAADQKDLAAIFFNLKKVWVAADALLQPR